MCKEKDDHLVRMKLIIQRTDYNLMLDIQEIFNATEDSKNSLKSAVFGWNES